VVLSCAAVFPLFQSKSSSFLEPPLLPQRADLLNGRCQDQAFSPPLLQVELSSAQPLSPGTFRGLFRVRAGFFRLNQIADFPPHDRIIPSSSSLKTTLLFPRHTDRDLSLGVPLEMVGPPPGSRSAFFQSFFPLFEVPFSVPFSKNPPVVCADSEIPLGFLPSPNMSPRFLFSPLGGIPFLYLQVRDFFSLFFLKKRSSALCRSFFFNFSDQDFSPPQRSCFPISFLLST